MKSLVELYIQQFKTTIATMFAYRASLLIWMIGQVLEPLVYLHRMVDSFQCQRRERRRLHNKAVCRVFHPANAGQPGHLHLGDV